MSVGSVLEVKVMIVVQETVAEKMLFIEKQRTPEEEKKA